MKIQLDLPPEINKRLKLKKIREDKRSQAQVVSEILELYFHIKEVKKDGDRIQVHN